MRQILLSTIDALYDISAELKTLTYLWTLIQSDLVKYFDVSDSLREGKENAADYILTLQLKTVAKLHELLRDNPFPAQSEDTEDT